MNFRGERAREDPEINFIPLIDVLLVILIFLMVTTTYQRVGEMSISLPRATASPLNKRPKEIIVGVDAQGNYFLNKAPFAFTTVSAMADALRGAAADDKDVIVIISADGQTVHQRVVHVMDAARQAGLHKVIFATQAPQSQ